MIDTHLHLCDESNEEIKIIFDNAKKNGVIKFILGGTSVLENKKNIDIANRFDNVFLTLGYHPSEADNIRNSDLELLRKQILNNNKVVAIGEIGLDYYWTKDNKDKQIKLFKKQLDLAKDLDLPVVIHARDATNDILNVLKDYNLKGCIHCFSGSYEVALEYIKLGFCLGIGGVVTFKNSKLENVIKQINLTHILLETDSPYLSPLRGEKNSPSNIKLIAEHIALIYGISLLDVVKITSENATLLFDLNSKL